MADIAVEAIPFTLNKPKLTLDNGTDVIEFECGANQLAVEVDQDESTTETFCGAYTTYKAEVWTVTVTGLTSFGTDGLWNNLRPLAGTICTLLIIPDEANAISDTNVAMQASVRVKAFSYLNASVGENSEVDIVLAVQGAPTFLTAPPV